MNFFNIFLNSTIYCFKLEIYKLLFYKIFFCYFIRFKR